MKHEAAVDGDVSAELELGVAGSVGLAAAGCGGGFVSLCSTARDEQQGADTED